MSGEMLHVYRFLRVLSLMLLALGLLACTDSKPDFSELGSLSGPSFGGSSTSQIYIDSSSDSVTIAGQGPRYLTDLNFSFDGGTTWESASGFADSGSDLVYTNGDFSIVIADISTKLSFSTDGESKDVLIKGVTAEGVLSSELTVTIIADFQAPSISTLALSSSSPTNNSSVTLSGMCSDGAGSGIPNNGIKICAKNGATCSYPTDYTITTSCGAGGSFSKAISVTSGIYEFSVVGIDKVSHASAPAGIASYVVDLDSPEIQLVNTPQSNGNYGVSSTFDIVVTLSENVIVSGSPRLKLNSGSGIYASYYSGSGTNTLTFNYTVAVGESATALNVSGVDLNGGSIQDLASNSASLTIASGFNLADTKNILIDTQAPTFTGVISDGSFISSLTDSPPLSWSTATDLGSGIYGYRVSIGTSPGSNDVLGWSDIGTTTSHSATTLSLTEGTIYYPSVMAIDNAGNSTILTGDGWIPDVTAPTLAGALEDGTDLFDTSKTPPLSWSSATDPVSGVAYYKVGLGLTPGATDAVTYFSVGNVTTTQLTGLTLNRGSEYFATVLAVDQAGNVSAPLNSDGFVVNSELWHTNGTVKAIVKSGKTIFLGGTFSRVGPFIGGGIPLDSTTGTLSWPNAANRARVSGDVKVSLSDGSGGFYIGGSFSAVGGIARSNLAHILPDGSVDPAFAPTVDSTVSAMALNGGTLYIGGSFNAVNSTSRNRLAAVDAIDGSLDLLNLSVTGTAINAMIADGSNLYIGGAFSSVGGSSRANLALIDVTTGTVKSFNPSAGGTVNALALSGSTLYVGGSFTTAGGQSRPRLAAIDTSTWLATSFNPSVSDTVYTIALYGPSVFIGGNFTTINGSTRNRFASINTSTGTLDALNISILGPVYSLAISGSKLYLGGFFSSAAGTTRRSLAAVELASGLLDVNFNPSVSGNVYTVSVYGSTVFAGGYITGVNDQDVARAGLAAIDTQTGTVTNYNLGLNSPVSALQLVGNALYLAGSFTYVNGISHKWVAAVDATTGANLPGFSMPTITGTNVEDIVHGGGKLYIGGMFTDIGGATRANLAAVDLATGTLDNTFIAEANGPVLKLAYSDLTSSLIVAGNFTQVNSTPRAKLAEINADGTLTNFNPNPTHSVYALHIKGSTLYVGGIFTGISSSTRHRLAAFDLGNSLALLPLNLGTVSGAVHSISTANGSLYLAGTFSSIYGQLRKGLAAVDASNGALDPTFVPYVSTTAGALLATDEAIYVGGTSSGTVGATGPTLFAPLNAITGDYLP